MRTEYWKWFTIEDGRQWEYGVALDYPKAGEPSGTVGSITKHGEAYHWRVWRVTNEEGQEAKLKKAQRQVEKICAPFLAPHMSDEAQELAQVGFRAYKNLLGDHGVLDVELWEDLPLVVRNAWAMAGLAIMAEAEKQLSSDLLSDE